MTLGSSFGKTILYEMDTQCLLIQQTLWAFGKNTHGTGIGKTSTYETGPINTGWRNIDQIGGFCIGASYSKALNQIGEIGPRWTKYHTKVPVFSLISMIFSISRKKIACSVLLILKIKN